MRIFREIEEVLFGKEKISCEQKFGLQIFEELSCKRRVNFILFGPKVEVGPAGGSYHKVCSIICRPLSIDIVESIKMLESLLILRCCGSDFSLYISDP